MAETRVFFTPRHHTGDPRPPVARQPLYRLPTSATLDASMWIVDPVLDLEALAEKYTTLARLRTRREQLESAGALAFADDERDARRSDFRRVAHAFPGALRELDRSSARLLHAKADVVHAELEAQRAAPSARPAPTRAWIAVVLDYHATWRELLAIKLFLARRRPSPALLTDADVEACRAWYDTLPAHARRLGWTIDAASLHHLRHPPGGRVTPLVWQRLGERHGLEHAALVQAIFGAPPGIAEDVPLPPDGIQR